MKPAYTPDFKARTKQLKAKRRKFRPFIDYDFPTTNHQEDMMQQLEKEIGRGRDDLSKMADSW
jgi:hypothetical protein